MSNAKAIKNSEQLVSECSNDSDINDNHRNDSRDLLDKTVVCNVNNCGKEYPDIYSYKRHLRGSHSDESLRCDHSECDFVTTEKALLK